MSTRGRRHRSSTAASTPPEATKATAELQILLDDLSTGLQKRVEDAYPDLPSIVEQVQAIRVFLIASSQTSRSKDDFRHLHGYQILLSTLRAFSGFYHPSKRNQQDKVRLFDLLENILRVLAQTFRDHYGNRRYFKRRVEGGGWAALEQIIASIGIGGSESDVWTEAQLFGRLLAFALDDKRLETLCQIAAECHPSRIESNDLAVSEDVKDTPIAPQDPEFRPENLQSDEQILQLVETRLQGILRESSLLHHADIVPVIIDFWKTIPRVPNVPVNPAALVVILTLSKISSISNHSLLALHSTGVLSTLLPLAFDNDSSFAATERQAVENLCGSLMSLGISSLNDAQYLVSSQSPIASEFLLPILYVDGEFAEQVKCQYPAPPPLANASTDSFASFTSTSAKTHPVQAFLGTPQDLSTRLGRGVVFSRWSLASAHLIEDVISDDLVAVYYRLGPRYNGNFQDCMGSFQTYEASAALGMRQELMHPGKEENSDILNAIRGKASVLVPESRIILSILPTAILGEEDRLKGPESQLLRGLNRTASNNLFQFTHNSGTSVAINGSTPAINEALTRAHGTAILTGEPVVIVPQALDDAMWRLGGFTTIGLKLVEAANTKESIVRAVENLFESINASWRNSEAMERENGYAILGALLRGKMGAGTVISTRTGGSGNTNMSEDDREKLGFQLLSLVLDFVGYSHERPEESFIINPLAYRILLVDFDMWRKTASITQRLYYKQFITFGVNRIVKRFLDALKAELFPVEVFSSFMEALTSLVKCNMTAEVFRSLALFITYAYHKPTSSASRTPKNPGLTIPIRSGTISKGPRRPTISTVFDLNEMVSPIMTKRQLGNRVLEMYTELLCEKGTTSNIRKFARTVTNKVFTPERCD
ncbi:hypothetical protein SS1G_03284 [Sclerotinia sclerotiorum 1980 UF-70]|uniref:Alfy-like armadillo-like repeat domain-containing protein n=1 Tax=Sclerotinia sclerotiorum (strain ATCC 18683 / 1980 / Ss-1) TaxID=665079 RepID=A7ED94_SCLS1|nr:hypothetical protein SS1G_03284 [Sclerotinia sclerotiorum 1980 UF-70]EDO00810.1 hypothetical protein SS1G_03284 [Sclerotinia sclerotiorum 1980 UF-70]